MSVVFRRHVAREATLDALDGLIPPRPSAGVGASAVAVTSDTALRHSAVWACLRLRANLISTFPFDVFRTVEGRRVELSKPPVLRAPGGAGWELDTWMYASQVDLDRGGNVFGLVTARDGFGKPAEIELVPLSESSVVIRKGEPPRYRLCGKLYDRSEVWHERQYPVAGLPVGLSPIAYAAWSVAEGLSIQDFALTWFSGGGTPRAHLRNTIQPTLTPTVASTTKERFKASVQSGDVFVTGRDWEYKPIEAQQTGMEWLEARASTATDIARFLDCPGDLIDAAVKGQSITYANITEKNLQFLIMHLGPAVIRRENALNRLLPEPRFVKANTDALLRMDPKSRAEQYRTLIDARVLAPSEARELDDRPPLTAAQIAEIDHFWPPRPATSSPSPTTQQYEGSLDHVG